jgi:hypothetical protein
VRVPCQFRLNNLKGTIFIELFLLSDQPVHPETVIVVEDELLVVGVFCSIVLEQVVALLVLPEFE